jgi:hypothetical protein
MLPHSSHVLVLTATKTSKIGPHDVVELKQRARTVVDVVSGIETVLVATWMVSGCTAPPGT